MKRTHIYITIIVMLNGLGLYCQSPPYILSDSPGLFRKIEQQLITEKITSLSEDCTTIITQQKNARVRGIAKFYLGQKAILDNDLSLAGAFFQEASLDFRTVSYNRGLGMLMSKWGEINYLQGDFERAIALTSQSIRYAEELEMHQVIVDASQVQANVFALTQQTDSSFSVLKYALEKAGFLPDQRTAKDILNQLATNYQVGGQLDSAIYYFHRLLLIKNELQDTAGLLSDYPAFGNLYRERGSYELAQQQYIKGFRLAELVKDSFSLMMLYYESGALYEVQQIINLSKENYHKALEIALLKGNTYLAATCYSKLARLSATEKNTAQAIVYYQKALLDFEQLGNKIAAADVRIALSECYENNSQYPIAKSYLLEAISIRKQSSDRLIVLKAKMALAKLEINYGKPQDGIKLVKACIKDFESMQDRESLQRSYGLLAMAYQKIGKPALAIVYYQDFMLLKDSLSSVERTKVISELGKKYDIEKKDNEILAQRLRIEQSENEIQRNNFRLLLLGAGLIFTLLVMTLLLFLYRKNKQVNLQRIKVLEKERESQLLRAIINGEERERKRVGQELHDGLGAVLATVKMQISSIWGREVKLDDHPALKKAEGLIDEACKAVREISHGMMPYALEQQGLEYAIEDLCLTISGTKQLVVHFHPFQVELIKSDELKVVIFRITQELLKNIISHAEAKEVIVQLTVEDELIELLVEDDGKGFDLHSVHQGIGLENMRSRIQYMKGKLTIDSRPGAGSTFVITVPL